jgi:hypothetical protein
MKMNKINHNVYLRVQLDGLRLALMSFCLIAGYVASALAQGNSNNNNGGGNSPVITGATANFLTNLITIAGTDLNVSGTPVVKLGTYPALVLVSSSATSIVATLPTGVAAGTYPLAVVSGAKSGAIDLTIGTTGPAGAEGPIGPQGIAGPQGPLGPQGPAGTKGDTGAVGPQGLKGDTGAIGAVGPQGLKGDIGTQGPIGLTGPKGDTGAVGATGPQGLKGDTGAIGAVGPQGPIGPQGPQGPAGTSCTLVQNADGTATLMCGGIGVTVASVSRSTVSKTGQTSCYDASGNMILCFGTGQEGAYQFGSSLVIAPARGSYPYDIVYNTPYWTGSIPRFTDNGNGTVTDNATHLIWLQNAYCTDSIAAVSNAPGTSWSNALTWSNTLASGVCGLSDGSTAGQWRLPNINELHSLIDYSRTWPALPSGHPFAHVDQPAVFWASTTLTLSPGNAWVMEPGYGTIWDNPKSFGRVAWAVRGGQ